METTTAHRPEILRGEAARQRLLTLVESAKVKSYPSDSFISEQEIRSLSDGYSIEHYELDNDTTVEVPLGMVVGATGFISWEQGRGSRCLKNGQKSSEIIKQYAGLDTPIPPIDDVSFFVTDEGELFAISNCAHRTAAAKVRGDETIKLNGGVRVYRANSLPSRLRDTQHDSQLGEILDTEEVAEVLPGDSQTMSEKQEASAEQSGRLRGFIGRVAAGSLRSDVRHIMSGSDHAER